MNDPKRLVIQRYFEELFNAGRLDVVDELLHPDYVNHSPGSPDLPRGRDGVRIVVAALRRAFPDLRYTIDDLVVGEDAVAVRATMTGTHEGELFGLPPTGRSVRVTQFTIERFEGASIVAHHRLTDDLTMMRQLGVLPS
ncbi:MAG: ester cyclase [Polyangiaceae bacterium]